ncbi:uncharacterized protein LOC126747151 isoform X3 [Anthonomus grandis grandis]|uniref:uncharacterized protein LOC126747151 isoform X3 n=1 Tax=Anthonomus grandis grandis TaxID=2921223 RepID=UPI002165913A|nr:uncharacterized protein LOC126747151 isoform X3 [Anthonomus grandis grandis]
MLCHMIIGRNHSNMILRDDSFWVFVKFLDGPVDLDLYDNCMIIIWRYTLVVEIYEDKDRPSLSYILVAERDVTRMIRSYDKRNLRYLSYRHRLHCSKRMRYEIIVSKRSQTIVGYDSTAQCWLEVRLKQSNDRWIMCYLIMPKELVGAASFLKEDHCYRIYSDAPMKRDKVYFFKELRIQGNPNQELRLLDPRSVIQEIEFPEDAPLHLSRYHAATFDELELFMRRTDHKFMFDLTAKIHRRVIVPNNLSPWCPRRHFREPYFGTGSSLQEKLTFKGDDASRWPIDLYLCNQENQVCHFGLLPGATVLITNVLSQKSRYLRTTVFTRVEVLEYPRPIYSSAHLVFEDFDSWVWHRQLRTAGPDLHVFSKILANSVVYSPVLVRHISSFKLNGGAHTFKMILEVQQERNTFLIESLDIFLLADLLGITGTNPAGARARKCLRSYCEVKPYKIFPQVAFDAKRPLHAKVIEPGRVFKDLISLITKFINYDLNPLMEVVLLRQAPDQEVPYRVMSCASSLEFSEF